MATQLFGVGIISKIDLENASNKARDRGDRANRLLLLLIGKLRGNPHWFDETCIALDKAGVPAVQEVRGIWDSLLVMSHLDFSISPSKWA